MSELREQLQATLGGAYTLERELGGGGMSRVFVATETALGRRVVVKVLPPEMSGAASAERFKREIQLAAQLRHPHVVPLHTAGDSGGSCTTRRHSSRVNHSAPVWRENASCPLPRLFASSVTWRKRWHTPMHTVWSVATSSRRTCCSSGDGPPRPAP